LNGPTGGLTTRPAAEIVLESRRRWSRLRVAQVAAALLFLAAGAAIGFLWSATPSGDDLPERVSAIADGRPLRPADVPQVLARAVVAVEDERFYQHHGLDTVGTARALWTDATGLCACEGGSTVTQQLAKLVYYPDQDRITRKVPGMAVALKIELRYGKGQIMADYLSVVRTGYGLVGARPAACAYFGRPLSQLTVAQAAELAGAVNAPSRYDPRYHPDETRDRRDLVLARMVETGYVSSAQAAAARAEPVVAGNVAHPSTC
jgi:penicillin-binding protein 1A